MPRHTAIERVKNARKGQQRPFLGAGDVTNLPPDPLDELRFDLSPETLARQRELQGLFVSDVSGIPIAGQVQPFQSGLDELSISGATAPQVQPEGLAETIGAEILGAPPELAVGAFQGLKTLGGRLKLQGQQALKTLQGDILSPQEADAEIRAFLKDEPKSRSLVGALGTGVGSLGLSEPALTAQEAATPLNTLIFGLFPPAAGVLAPLGAALPVIRAGTLGRFAKPAVRPAPPFPAVTRPVSEVLTPEEIAVIKPARAKPSNIPNGPRVADPSGPPPVVPAAGRILADEPEDILARIQRLRTPDEAADVTLLRRHEGAITAAQNEIRITTDAGNALLKDLGIGRVVRGRLAPTPVDIPVMDDLFNALHNPSKVTSGEVVIPDGFGGVYDDLRRITNLEESMRIDFDPAMATVDDYFYRGWKAPEGVGTSEAGRGQVGARPGFKKPRVDASYQEMRDAGFEPLFWNPYEQTRVSSLMGVRFREQTQLIDDLKNLSIAVPDSGGTGLKGWRTPKIGPAFQGKPFVITVEDGSKQVAFTRRWVVPDEIANRLENIYGVPQNFGKVHVAGREIDLLKVVDAVTFIPKRAKLFGSFFQQQDFIQRNLIGTWTGMIDALRAGQPVEAVQTLARWPKSAYTIIEANLGPGARNRIRQTLNSTEPILEGRPGVHFRGIMESGLSNIDATLLPGNIDQVARLAAGDVGLLSVKRVTNLVVDLEGQMRRGLFEGVYPAAQVTDIRNNIAPILARKFPNLSDEALNGLIARTTNIKYSTIPASQSVFQNRLVRDVLSRVFFSIGESEGLLRQAVGAIKGPNAAYWRKHWIGAYLSVIATANVIHFASTGENLPFDRYSPISRNGFGPLPLGYNRDFAAPDIPFTGRSSTELMLDVVGQMDTAFRILDPVNFLTSRESVPVRALQTQITGKGFFGEPIDKVGPGGIVSRTSQLIQDVLLPIGPGQAAAQAAREVIPGAEGIIGEAEGRIGTPGRAIQATGLNVRGETTSALLDRTAAESGLSNTTTGQPIRTWAELSGRQKDAVMIANPDLERELELRQETAVLRGNKKAEGFQKLDQAGVDRFKREEALVQDLMQGVVNEDRFRTTYGTIQALAAEARATINDNFQLFQLDRELPKDPNQRALVQYYEVFDKARRESTVMDFDLLEVDLGRLEASWTDAQKQFVDSETGRTEHPPLVQEFLNDRDGLQDYFNIVPDLMDEFGLRERYREYLRSKDQTAFREDHPQLDTFIKIGEADKLKERETNLKVERLLYKWGYIDSPRNTLLLFEIDELRGAQGGRVENRQAITEKVEAVR